VRRYHRQVGHFPRHDVQVELVRRPDGDVVPVEFPGCSRAFLWTDFSILLNLEYEVEILLGKFTFQKNTK
jgi:hypothetical protein